MSREKTTVNIPAKKKTKFADRKRIIRIYLKRIIRDDDFVWVQMYYSKCLFSGAFRCHKSFQKAII